MAGRIATINGLKDRRVIGENNKGLLEFRTSSKPQQQLAAAENKDHSAVYKAIAKKQGASSKMVGQRQANMIHYLKKPVYRHHLLDEYLDS